MPIREFICPEHGRFERVVGLNVNVAPCEHEVGGVMMDGSKHVWPCGIECKSVEFSVPARRNPRHGEQR